MWSLILVRRHLILNQHPGFTWLNRSEHFDELKCYFGCQLPVQSRTIWRFAENTDPNVIKSFGNKLQHSILALSTMGRHSVYRCQQRDGILVTDVNRGTAFCLPMSTEGRHSVYRCQQRDGILSADVNRGTTFCLQMSTEGRHSVYRCQQRDGILSTDVNRGTAFCLPMSTEGRHSVYRCQQRDGILSTNDHAHWYISWPGIIYRYLTISRSRSVLGPSRSWQSFQFNLDSMQVRCLSIWYRYAPVNSTPWYFSSAGTVCR